MKRSFSNFLLATLVGLVLATFAMTPYAEAAERGGGGRGGGGGGGARAGGGEAARAQGGGGNRQAAQVNNTKADARTDNVRNTSVNNVNASRNVNVNVQGNSGCCNNNGWDNPVAAAMVVGATAAAIGSIVRAPPPGCVPVNHGGMVYQQCGGTWYAPQGSQYIVVNPPM